MVEEYREQFTGLMEREVTRGEFLKFVGLALLGLIGVLGFIKHLHEIMPARAAAKNLPHSGFGGGAYGR